MSNYFDQYDVDNGNTALSTTPVMPTDSVVTDAVPADSTTSMRQLLADINSKISPAVHAVSDAVGLNQTPTKPSNYFDKYDTPAANANYFDRYDEKPDTGFMATLKKSGEAVKAGIGQAVGELAAAPAALNQQAPPSAPTTPQPDFTQEQPFSELIKPSIGIPRALFVGAKTLPTITGAAVGGGIGEAVTGGNPLGGIAGTFFGAGVASAAQSIAPHLQARQQQFPHDQERAYNEAINDATLDGAFSGLGFAAFGFAPFKVPGFSSAVKNILVQAGIIQPAVSEAERGVENIRAGRPITEGMAETYPVAAVGTALPLAAHLGAKVVASAIKGKPATPVKPTATETINQTVAPQPLEPTTSPGAVPASPVASRFTIEPTPPDVESIPFEAQPEFKGTIPAGQHTIETPTEIEHRIRAQTAEIINAESQPAGAAPPQEIPNEVQKGQEDKGSLSSGNPPDQGLKVEPYGRGVIVRGDIKTVRRALSGFSGGIINKNENGIIFPQKMAAAISAHLDQNAAVTEPPIATAKPEQIIPENIPASAPETSPPVTQPEIITPQQQALSDLSIQNRDRTRPASVEQMQSIARNPDYDRLGVAPTPDVGAPMVSTTGGGEPAGAHLGKEARVTFADGAKFPVRYAVVDADQVQASHNADGTVNQSYYDAQPGVLRALNNGRVAGVQEAYQRGIADNYKQALMDNAAEHGVPAKDIQSMKQPMLVRLFDDRLTRANDMGRKSNAQQGLGYSATETALNDASHIDLTDFKPSEDGDVLAASNSDFINRFMQTVPQNERAGLIDANRQPTKQLADRIQAAVFARAYRNHTLIASAIEEADPDFRNVLRAMTIAAPHFAATANTEIPAKIAKAALFVQRARRSGVSVNDALAQTDAFERDPDADTMARIMRENSRSPRRLAALLSDLGQQAHNEERQAATGDIFGNNTATTTEEKISHARNKTTEATAAAEDHGADVAPRHPHGQQTAGAGVSDQAAERTDFGTPAANVPTAAEVTPAVPKEGASASELVPAATSQEVTLDGVEARRQQVEEKIGGEPVSLTGHGDLFDTNESTGQGDLLESAKVKEPWEMSRDEFNAIMRVQRTGNDMRVHLPDGETNLVPGTASRTTALDKTRRFVLERAIRDGEHVPPEVLADYPDLQSRAAATAAPQPDKGILFSRPKEKAPVFYSELGRQVDAIKQNSATPEQWNATIANLKGVKKDEIEWSGINDWLALQKGPVTKQQISDFLKTNGVQVNDVTLGEHPINRNSKYALPEVLKAARSAGNIDDDLLLTIANDEDAYRALTNKFPHLANDEGWAEKVVNDVFGGTTKIGTKFSQFQLPGGKNYREMLLTLPAPYGEPEQQVMKSLRDKYGLHSADWFYNNKDKLSREDRGRLDAITASVGEKENRAFRSAHFDQTNILTHIRFNDRTDADGKKVLFIEELQSDWAQQGKREGFDEQDKKGSRPMAPSAPFVGKTDAWVSLALKRLIIYAAENGYDHIAWTNGEQQAARYDLSKQLSRIQYTKDHNLVAYDHNGKEVITRIVEPDKLQNVIGKDAADKILAQPEPNEYKPREISGIDLKVGGEGMKAFYDKIVPNIANDVLRKLGGGNVGDIDLRNSEVKGYKTFRSDETASYPTIHQQGFNITPALREKAMQGLPLFSRPKFSIESQQAVGKRMDDKINADPQKAVDWYIKKFGNVVSADNAKEYSDDYNASNEARAMLSYAVREPSSHLAKMVYERLLSKPVQDGKTQTVLFTAGGTGAGKTRSIRTFIEKPDILYDGNLDNTKNAINKIDAALKSGRRVMVRYIYREPVDALINGVIPRAEIKGRTISLYSHESTHINASKTIRELAQHYKDNPSVMFEAIDNSHGNGKAMAVSLESLPKIDENGLHERLSTALEDAQRAGRLSPHVYEGISAQEAASERSRGRGQYHQTDASQSEQPRPRLDYPIRSSDQPRSGGVSVSDARNELVGKLGEAAVSNLERRNKLRIVDQVDELPPDAVKAAGGGVVWGYHDAGTSYLVASQLERGETLNNVYGTLLHEAGIHGLRDVLGDKFHNDIIVTVGKALKRAENGIRDPMSAAVSRARLLVHEDTPPDLKDEETIAYLVQDRAVQKFGVVKRIFTALKAWLFRHGIISAGKLHPDDLVALARQVVKLSAHNEFGRRAAAPMPAFSRSREDQLGPLAGGKGVAAEFMPPGGVKSEFPSDEHGFIKSLGYKVRDYAKQLSDAYTRPPEITPLKKIIGKYTGAMQEIDFNLHKLAKRLNATLTKDKQEAITNYMQAGGDEKLLAQRAQDSAPEYRRGYEDALKLTPEEKAQAAAIRQRHDDLWTLANAAGILEDYVNNYVRGEWERPDKAGKKLIAQVNAGIFRTKPREAMHKVFENYFEGEQAGYKPKNKSIGYQMVAAERSIRSAIEARAALKSMMGSVESDGRPTVAVGGAGSPLEAGETEKPYFIKPNAKGHDTTDYQYMDHPALRKWKWVGNDSEGKPILLQGNMWIHPKAMGRLKALLGRSWMRTVAIPESVPIVGGAQPFRAALEAGAFVKGTILIGPFHQFHVGEHAIFHNVNPLSTPEIDFEKRPLLREGVNHGLMLYNHNAMSDFGEGLASGGLFHRIPKLGDQLKRYQEWLFQDYIPRLKAAMFEQAVQRAEQYYAKDIAAGKFTRDQLLENAASQANAAFGEQNYKYIGRNPTLQDALKIALLAPDFLEARLKFAGQAVSAKGREQMMALIRGAIIMSVAAQTINLMFSDDHKTNWGKPFSLIIGGREYTPRSVVGDLAHLILDPRGFWYHRLNPLWGRPLLEMASGRDQNGQKIGVVDAAKDILKSWTPIPAQGFFKKNMGNTMAQSVINGLLQSIGISNQPHKTAAERKVSDINFGHMQVAPRLPQAQARHEAFIALLDDFRSGDLKSMSDVNAEARKQKIILTTEQRKQILESRATGPQADTKRMRDRMRSFSAEEAMQVWEEMSPEERQRMKAFVISKVVRSTTTNHDDKVQYIHQIKTAP